VNHHFISHTVPCITDIDQWYYCLGEEGVGHSPFIGELKDSRVDHMLAVAP